MDVSGLDAAYKLVILTGVAFKSLVTIDQIHYEGIEEIGLEDIQYADELGYTIKLLAIGTRLDEGLSLKVVPTLIANSHPLAAIHNEMNAVFVSGDAVGEALLAGNGAGGFPTGSAVVSDMIDIIFDTENKVTRRNLEEDFHKEPLISMDSEISGFYLRLFALDQSGTFEKISTIFSDHGISIANIIQKKTVEDLAEIVIITHQIERSKMLQCLSDLSNTIRKVACCLRVNS